MARRSHGCRSAGAGLVGLVGLLRLIEYAAGREFAVDEWFFHVRREQLGLAPIGKMSLPTAIAFVAASWRRRGARLGPTDGNRRITLTRRGWAV